ncbi:MAG: CBS domain-containing protein [Bacteroidia bacterium]
MFASQLISQEIFPLKRADSPDTALMFFDDWQIKYLPVIENGKVLGWLTQDEASKTQSDKIENILFPANPLFEVSENTHVFDLLQKFNGLVSDTLVINDSEGKFLGLISSRELGASWHQSSALMQAGSVLVLEVPSIQYSLAELSRISESNQVKIIHVMIEPAHEDPNRLFVSLKFNREDISFVISSYERFGYPVLYTNAGFGDLESMQDRYKWLMKFIQS